MELDEDELPDEMSSSDSFDSSDSLDCSLLHVSMALDLPSLFFLHFLHCVLGTISSSSSKVLNVPVDLDLVSLAWLLTR